MATMIRRKRKNVSRTRRKAGSRVPGSIPVITPSSASHRLAAELDLQVSKAKFNDRRIAPHRSRVMGGMIRDYKGSFFTAVEKIGVAAFAWPDGMYVPRDKSSGVSFLKAPADHLYTHDWTDGRGVSNADKNAGTLFALTFRIHHPK